MGCGYGSRLTESPHVEGEDQRVILDRFPEGGFISTGLVGPDGCHHQFPFSGSSVCAVMESLGRGGSHCTNGVP